MFETLENRRMFDGSTKAFDSAIDGGPKLVESVQQFTLNQTMNQNQTASGCFANQPIGVRTVQNQT